MSTSKFIITQTECYKGNATHGTHQHQGVLILNEKVEPFFKFENGPADSDRSITTIFEKKITPEIFQKIIKLKKDYFANLEKLTQPSLDGSKPYQFKRELESFSGMKIETEKALKEYNNAMDALFSLSTTIDPFINKMKFNYCEDVWKLLDEPKNIKYFKSIFY